MVGTGRATRSTPETWPSGECARGMIDLHWLPPVPSINGARIRELTGEESIPPDAEIALRVHHVIAGDRSFSSPASAWATAMATALWASP